MSHRRGRVQTVSPEDELDNLQQLLVIQPLTTTPSSSTPSASSDPSTIDEERLHHRPPHLSDDEWRWLINFWGTLEAKAQKRDDQSKPNRIEMFVLIHTKKDGKPVDDHCKEIMLLSQTDGISSFSSTASTSTSSVDEIYTQVMGSKRHGHVQGYGFGLTPTSIFGPRSRRQSIATLTTQLENTVQELSNVKEELLHVKKIFEKRLIEVQRKTREEVKEEFNRKMIEMQKVQAQLQEQMMQMMQQFQQRK